MNGWIHVDHGDDAWAFDAAFLESNWTCIWDAGCAGIADIAAPEAQLGCCSVGAEMLDDDEAMRIAALAATLDEETAQFAAHIEASGALREVESSRAAWATRVVDGACIFLNRPGFPGGSGCALHLAANAHDESHVDWKPSICWQLPVKIEISTLADGSTQRTLRKWLRSDWGPEGASMAWCCTEQRASGADADGAHDPHDAQDTATAANAFVGAEPVIESLSVELTELLGPDLMDALCAEVDRRSEPGSALS